MCPLRDFQAHPAFSRLFLEGTLTGEGAVFRRRPRGEEKILSLAALWDGEGATACLDRAQALGRGGLRALAGRRPGPLEAGRGTDPCLMICIPVALEPGERRVFHLALAAGDSPDVALEGARRVLEGRGGEEGSLAPLVRRLGLEQRQALEAFRLLSELAAVRQPGPRPPQSQLWAFGVSGDLPIAAGRVSGEEESRQAELWCAWHQLLTRSGYPFDLVLLVDEGGDYRRPLHSAVAEKLKQLGAEGALGAKGGIHLVPAGAEELMTAWAGARLPLSPPDQAAGEEQAPPLPAVRLTEKLPIFRSLQIPRFPDGRQKYGRCDFLALVVIFKYMLPKGEFSDFLRRTVREVDAVEKALPPFAMRRVYEETGLSGAWRKLDAMKK